MGIRLRPFWVRIHRWAGLGLALFLCVAGLTGSVLAFRDRIDLLVAPQVHRIAPPAPGAAMLSPQDLRERVMARYPGGTIDYLPLHGTPGRSVILQVERRDRATGGLVPWSTQWDELFVDPYTGAVIGHRRLGDITEGLINLMPFLLRVHYSLALGPWGLLAFGIAALVWTLDCFVGFYLTLPVRQTMANRDGRPRAAARSWARWRPAWTVRWRAGHYKRTFDLHRATGLWLWPMLLIFAWSGVFFNLSTIYTPVMRAFGYRPVQSGLVAPPAARHTPRLDFRAAERRGRALALREAGRHGLTIAPLRETALLHRPDAGAYVYIFTTSADMRDSGGRSLAIFDSDTGRLMKLVLPRGQSGANTFTEWISALHMADVWGLPWRIGVALMGVGVGVAVLSVTGVAIWSRKRRARRPRRDAPPRSVRESHPRPFFVPPVAACEEQILARDQADQDAVIIDDRHPAEIVRQHPLGHQIDGQAGPHADHRTVR
jgi:uncharacterized iron-regulated membrane protein